MPIPSTNDLTLFDIFFLSRKLFKTKLTELNTNSHKQISHLQEEAAKLKAVKDEMQRYIRELEQKNDDLERNYRCAMFSLDEFESKLENAVERNALLESELDEKNQLAETVQRLRDEARDLKQELAVRSQLKLLNKMSSSSSIPATTELLNAGAGGTDLTHSSSSNKMDTSESFATPLVPAMGQGHTPPLNTILNELNLQQMQNNNNNNNNTNSSNGQRIVNLTNGDHVTRLGYVTKSTNCYDAKRKVFFLSFPI